MNKENREWRMKEIEKLLMELLEISRQEREFVENCQWEKTEMDSFDKLLEKRQTLMEQIEGVHFEEDESHVIKQQEDSPRLKEMEAHRKRCQICIEQIQKNDLVSRSGLEKAAQQSSSKITNTRDVKKASKAYVQHSQESAWFFDKRK